LPSKGHPAKGILQLGKRGQTDHIERFNNTLWQRCSRLMRKTLSFSKKVANRTGGIWYFIHNYNAQRGAKLNTTTFA
jgi:hypothetical protein